MQSSQQTTLAAMAGTRARPLVYPHFCDPPRFCQTER
jgi:hypothetical protein